MLPKPPLSWTKRRKASDENSDNSSASSYLSYESELDESTEVESPQRIVTCIDTKSVRNKSHQIKLSPRKPTKFPLVDDVLVSSLTSFQLDFSVLSTSMKFLSLNVNIVSK